MVFQETLSFKRLKIPESPSTFKGRRDKFMEGKFTEDYWIHRKLQMTRSSELIWSQITDRSITYLCSVLVLRQLLCSHWRQNNLASRMAVYLSVAFLFPMVLILLYIHHLSLGSSRNSVRYFRSHSR